MTDKEVEVFLEAKEKLSKIDKNLTLKEYTNNKQLMTTCIKPHGLKVIQELFDK